MARIVKTSGFGPPTYCLEPRQVRHYFARDLFSDEACSKGRYLHVLEILTKGIPTYRLKKSGVEAQMLYTCVCAVNKAGCNESGLYYKDANRNVITRFDRLFLLDQLVGTVDVCLRFPSEAARLDRIGSSRVTEEPRGLCRLLGIYCMREESADIAERWFEGDGYQIIRGSHK